MFYRLNRALDKEIRLMPQIIPQTSSQVNNFQQINLTNVGTTELSDNFIPSLSKELIQQSIKTQLSRRDKSIVMCVGWFMFHSKNKNCVISRDKLGGMLDGFGYKRIRRRQVTEGTNTLEKIGVLEKTQAHAFGCNNYKLTDLGLAIYFTSYCSTFAQNNPQNKNRTLEKQKPHTRNNIILDINTPKRSATRYVDNSKPPDKQNHSVGRVFNKTHSEKDKNMEATELKQQVNKHFSCKEANQVEQTLRKINSNIAHKLNVIEAVAFARHALREKGTPIRNIEAFVNHKSKQLANNGGEGMADSDGKLYGYERKTLVEHARPGESYRDVANRLSGVKRVEEGHTYSPWNSSNTREYIKCDRYERTQQFLRERDAWAAREAVTPSSDMFAQMRRMLGR